MNKSISWMSRVRLMSGCFLLSAMAVSVQAESFWSNAYVTFSVNEGPLTTYQLGTIGSYTQWQGSDLGSVFSLTLTEFTIDYQSVPADRWSGQLYYALFVGGDSESWLDGDQYWTQQDLSGGNYRGTWSGEIDLLNGAASQGAPAELHFWAVNDGDSGFNYFDNNENYFVATLFAIPEPATLGLLGLGAMALFLRRKSRK